MEKQEALEHRLTIMIGPSLKQAIEAAAYSRNLSVGAWLRRCATDQLDAAHPARAEVIEGSE